MACKGNWDWGIEGVCERRAEGGSLRQDRTSGVASEAPSQRGRGEICETRGLPAVPGDHDSGDGRCGRVHRRGLAGRSWVGGGLVVMGLVIGALVGAANAQQCKAGSYSTAGGCQPCDGGWASMAGQNACTQILSGSIANKLDTAVFAHWQQFDLSVGDALTAKFYAVATSASAAFRAETAPHLMASEEWGLPTYTTFCGGEDSRTHSECTDGGASDRVGTLQFMPRENQMGGTFEMCAEARIRMIAGWALQPLLMCLKARVVRIVPMLSNSSNLTEYWTLSDDYQFVGAIGCPVEIPIEVTASTCTVTDCAISKVSNLAGCATACGDDVPLTPSILGELPKGAEFSRRKLNAMGMPHTKSDRPQLWAVTWVPELYSATQIPYRVCVSPGPGGASRCWTVIIEKCKHCVRPLDTMDSIAKQHGAGWLQLYFANPLLRSHNPQVVAPGSSLKLGVSYKSRQGDYLELLAEKFLVSTEDILRENVELWAPAMAQYEPRAPGYSTQVSVHFNATRNLREGETITLTLPELSGVDWVGMAAVDCAEMEMTMTYGPFEHMHIKPCVQQESAPGQACGPGGWGECEYDRDSKIACNVKQCKSYGTHPKLGAARWIAGAKKLVVDVRSGVTIMQGETVSYVVPRTAGMAYPHRGHPLSELKAVFPLPMTIEGLNGRVPFKTCVILPVCDPGLQCLYGTDCKIVSSTS